MALEKNDRRGWILKLEGSRWHWADWRWWLHQLEPVASLVDQT